MPGQSGPSLLRVITLFQLELRAGKALQGHRRQRFIVVLLWLWSPAAVYSLSLWHPTLAPKSFVGFTHGFLLIIHFTGGSPAAFH